MNNLSSLLENVPSNARVIERKAEQQIRSIVDLLIGDKLLKQKSCLILREQVVVVVVGKELLQNLTVCRPRLWPRLRKCGQPSAIQHAGSFLAASHGNLTIRRCWKFHGVRSGLTTQAQRRRPRGAPLATVMRCRRSLKGGIRNFVFGSVSFLTVSPSPQAGR